MNTIFIITLVQSHSESVNFSFFLSNEQSIELAIIDELVGQMN